MARSRQPVSKTISAFLNSAKGGTIYLGVSDEHQVKGLTLTLLQADHVALSLADTLARFRPPVPWGEVTAQFVPVLDDDVKTEEVERYIEREQLDERRMTRAHRVGTDRDCWCDVDSQARCNHGLLPMRFVVEILVKPWNGEFGDRPPTSPLYENEEGLCYFRRTGSNFQPELKDIVNWKEAEMRAYYAKKNAEIRAKIDALIAQKEMDKMKIDGPERKEIEGTSDDQGSKE